MGSNTLFNIHEKPMTAQKTFLEKTFDEWKSEKEQVDDVTILGLCV